MSQPLPTVYLARHGETVWSTTGQHTGRTDIPLTATGEQQARALRTTFADLHPALVLCSPRQRAVETARLAGLPAPVIARARDILSALEHDELSRGGRPTLSGVPPAPQQQLGLFQSPPEAPDALRERIRELDLNRTTPLEALQILSDLKRDIE